MYTASVRGGARVRPPRRVAPLCGDAQQPARGKGSTIPHRQGEPLGAVGSGTPHSFAAFSAVPTTAARARPRAESTCSAAGCGRWARDWRKDLNARRCLRRGGERIGVGRGQQPLVLGGVGGEIVRCSHLGALGVGGEKELVRRESVSSVQCAVGGGRGGARG